MQYTTHNSQLKPTSDSLFVSACLVVVTWEDTIHPNRHAPCTVLKITTILPSPPYLFFTTRSYPNLLVKQCRQCRSDWSDLRKRITLFLSVWFNQHHGFLQIIWLRNIFPPDHTSSMATNLSLIPGVFSSQTQIIRWTHCVEPEEPGWEATLI